jgi:hypothetical protein
MGTSIPWTLNFESTLSQNKRTGTNGVGTSHHTIIDRLKGRRGEKLGRSTELSKEEEEHFVERILVMSNWGFPLSKGDLTNLIKHYLDRQGRTTRFTDNLPGRDFVRGFLKRHPRLSVRKVNLIKRGRAVVSQGVVNKFLTGLRRWLLVFRLRTSTTKTRPTCRRILVQRCLLWREAASIQRRWVTTAKMQSVLCSVVLPVASLFPPTWTTRQRTTTRPGRKVAQRMPGRGLQFNTDTKKFLQSIYIQNPCSKC